MQQQQQINNNNNDDDEENAGKKNGSTCTGEVNGAYAHTLAHTNQTCLGTPYKCTNGNVGKSQARQLDAATTDEQRCSRRNRTHGRTECHTRMSICARNIFHMHWECCGGHQLPAETMRRYAMVITQQWLRGRRRACIWRRMMHTHRTKITTDDKWRFIPVIFVCVLCDLFVRSVQWYTVGRSRGWTECGQWSDRSHILWKLLWAIQR